VKIQLLTARGDETIIELDPIVTAACEADDHAACGGMATVWMSDVACECECHAR